MWTTSRTIREHLMSVPGQKFVHISRWPPFPPTPPREQRRHAGAVAAPVGAGNGRRHHRPERAGRARRPLRTVAHRPHPLDRNAVARVVRVGCRHRSPALSGADPAGSSASVGPAPFGMAHRRGSGGLADRARNPTRGAAGRLPRRHVGRIRPGRPSCPRLGQRGRQPAAAVGHRLVSQHRAGGLPVVTRQRRAAKHRVLPGLPAAHEWGRHADRRAIHLPGPARPPAPTGADAAAAALHGGGDAHHDRRLRLGAVLPLPAGTRAPGPGGHPGLAALAGDISVRGLLQRRLHGIADAARGSRSVLSLQTREVDRGRRMGAAGRVDSPERVPAFRTAGCHRAPAVACATGLCRDA